VTAARRPGFRAGPGIAAWAALPERDRGLLLWLVHGDVVTAELAGLLAYGHRRIAQRRLARLVEYGLLTGFWAANRQRPRGRYAYSLTKPVRAALERSVWPEGRPPLFDGAPEAVSPVIHGLATHDVLAAFLRAGDPGRGYGLAAWAPERPCIRLTRGGFLRPDALAVVRAGDASIVLAIERDLGTERGPVLAAKLERYRRVYDGSPARAPLHVGFVVDSARRAASVRARLRGGEGGGAPGGSAVSAWVVAEPALAADPYGAAWTAPEGAEARVVDLAPHWSGDPWPWLRPGDLSDPAALEALDDRVYLAVPMLAGPAR
jgi:hypothetical protein